MLDVQRECVQCGSEFWGRRDKKFCSDGCRSAHHNDANASGLTLMKQVNAILKKNRKILEELNPKGKTKLKKKKLSEAGFNFDYFTSQYTTKTGNLYYFCYEHGYIYLEDDWLALVVKQDYAKS